MAIDKITVFRTKRKIALYSVIVNSFLSGIKLVGGIITGSSALIADGVHSLSDVAASLSILLGIILSNRKSRAFPYGLYKVENLVSLLSAFAIFFAGYEIGREVLFSTVKPMTSLPLALGVILLTLITTFSFSRYEQRQGEKINSPGLVADARHVMTDFYSSLVVVIGVVAQYLHLIWLMKGVVLIIIGFVFYSGFEILKDAIKVLLDASVDNQTIEQVKQILNNHPEVVKINSVQGRSSGSYKFLELDIAIDIEELDAAHSFVEHLKDHILNEVEFVEDVVIHFEPAFSQMRIAVLTDGQGYICKHFGSCENIVIFTKENGELRKEVYKNPALELERHKAIELAEFLKHKHVRCVVSRNFPEKSMGPKLLQDFRIRLVRTDKIHLDDLDIATVCG